MVGLMFLLCGGIYTLSAPVWGLLIDKYHCTTGVMIFGSATTVISMALIGPSPFFPFDKNLIVIGISLAILGVAAGALYIPTFQSCLDAVKLPEYEALQSFLSMHQHHLNIMYNLGLMETFAGLGYTAGPVIGGFLYEFGGFQVPFLVLGVILIFATALAWMLIENYKD
ncbi:hypothetical protein ANCDUO_19046, partial [Ancylostoma duodenale]